MKLKYNTSDTYSCRNPLSRGQIIVITLKELQGFGKRRLSRNPLSRGQIIVIYEDFKDETTGNFSRNPLSRGQIIVIFMSRSSVCATIAIGRNPLSRGQIIVISPVKSKKSAANGKHVAIL